MAEQVRSLLRLTERADHTGFIVAFDTGSVSRRHGRLSESRDAGGAEHPSPSRRLPNGGKEAKLPTHDSLGTISMRLLPIITLAVCGSFLVGPTQATEGGASLFIPGGHGPGAGIVPPPGFYFANEFFTYSGEISGGRRIQIGGAVLADVQTELRADFASATWVTPLDILGGRVAFGLILPFGIPG